MRRKGVEKYSDGKKIFSVLVFIIIFLIVSISPKSVKADNGQKYFNYFYINVIHNVLAVTKTSNTNEQHANSEEINTGMEVLSVLGVDILNPISIITKEIAYLDKNEFTTDLDNESKVEKVKEFIINPFNLDDKQVTRSDVKVPNGNVIANLYNPKLKQTLNKTAPRLLIYHSHTCEAYRTSDKETLKTTNSLDATRSVVGVGDVITEELEKYYGISVIHDKTVHDKGDYNNAYKKSGVTLDKYLKEYGNFDLIIDLHRDSVENKNTVTTKINGENVAQIMFVVAQKNSKYATQKKLINSMIGVSKKIYPTLLREEEITVVNRGKDFYNQHKSNNAMLIEVGTYTNDIKEVKNTGMYLSRIIAEQLNGKK